MKGRWIQAVVKAPRALRRAGAFAAGDVLGKGMALAALGASARMLTDDDYGRLVTTLAAAALASVVLDAGLSPRLIDLTLHAPRDAAAYWTIKYGQFVAFAAIGAVTCAVNSGPPIWLATLLAASTIQLVHPGVLVALARTRSAFAALVLGPSTWLLIVLTGVVDGAVDGVLAFAAGNLLAGVVCQLGNPELRPRRVAPRAAAALLRTSAPTAVFAIASNGYSRVDTLLLAWLAGPAVAGVYGTAYRFVTTTVGLTGFIVATAARRLAAVDAGLERRVRRQVAGYAAVAAVGMTALLGPLTRLVAGDSLSTVAQTLLALAVLPAVLVLFYTQTALLRGARQSLMGASLKVAATAACMYPPFILWAGVEGAALASVLVEAVAALMYRQVLASERGSRRSGGASAQELLRPEGGASSAVTTV